jgi:hypothetical protein
MYRYAHQVHQGSMWTVYDELPACCWGALQTVLRSDSGTMQVKDLGPRVSTTHAPGYWYICRFTYHLICIYHVYHVPSSSCIPPSETTFRWCGHVLVEPCRTQARVSCMYANSLVHLLFYTALSMFVHTMLDFLTTETPLRWWGSSWICWVQLCVCFLFFSFVVTFLHIGL